MGIKLISSLFSFLFTLLLCIGVAYCFIRLFFRKKNSNANKNRQSTNHENNIIHINYPMSDTPFYVTNQNEIVPLQNTTQPSNQTSINIGWKPETQPSAPILNDDINQPPPPYSAVIIQNTH